MGEMRRRKVGQKSGHRRGEADSGKKKTAEGRGRGRARCSPLALVPVWGSLRRHEKYSGQ